ncbi:MAG: hypothetical protein FWE33_00150 [Defluviitaleaceae bacterium]|nr:hypothetical protein [Defluviitaleaceae bacterium]
MWAVAIPFGLMGLAVLYFAYYLHRQEQKYLQQTFAPKLSIPTKPNDEIKMQEKPEEIKVVDSGERKQHSQSMHFKADFGGLSSGMRSEGIIDKLGYAGIGVGLLVAVPFFLTQIVLFLYIAAGILGVTVIYILSKWLYDNVI